MTSPLESFTRKLVISEIKFLHSLSLFLFSYSQFWSRHQLLAQIKETSRPLFSPHNWIPSYTGDQKLVSIYLAHPMKL